MLKGIILAGGKNTRLAPLTTAISKQLLPVYDKPMIFYPYSTLLCAGCREILVIVRSDRDEEAMRKVLPVPPGVKLTYELQLEPRGIADAFLIAGRCEFLQSQDQVLLILGDNLFHGDKLLAETLLMATTMGKQPHVFLHQVSDARSYGVAEFTERGGLARIVEKPDNPPSRWVQTGLYLHDYSVIQIARDLKPSARGELEIADISNAYLDMQNLRFTKSLPGMCWFDMGTADDLQAAGNYVAAIQKRQGTLVGCPLTSAVLGGLADATWVAEQAAKFQNEYGAGLARWLEGRADV